MNTNWSLFLAGFFLTVFLTACGDTSEKASDQQETESTEQTMGEQNQAAHEGHDHDAHMEGEGDKTGPEYTSRYICPMYCEGSGASEPGICPVCGMDYVLNEKYQEADSMQQQDHDHHEHDHDHAHEHEEG